MAWSMVCPIQLALYGWSMVCPIQLALYGCAFFSLMLHSESNEGETTRWRSNLESNLHHLVQSPSALSTDPSLLPDSVLAFHIACLVMLVLYFFSQALIFRVLFLELPTRPLHFVATNVRMFWAIIFMLLGCVLLSPTASFIISGLSSCECLKHMV